MVIATKFRLQRAKEKMPTSKRDLEEACKSVYSRRRLHKGELKEADEDSGIVPCKVKEKRRAKDPSTLSERYQSIKTECRRLNESLEQQQTELQHLRARYDTLTEALQEAEEAKLELQERNCKLKEENVRRNEDAALLKNVIFRLNTQLERYQDKTRQKTSPCKQRVSNNGSDAAIDKKQLRAKHELAAWDGLSVLGSLLNAYEENLMEKEELVIMYEREMVDFAGRCKEILAENQRMQKEVEHLTSQCDRYADEVAALVRNVTSLKKQNDFLLHQIGEQKRDTNEICCSYRQRIECILEREQALRKENAAAVLDLCTLGEKYHVACRQLERRKSKEEKTIPLAIHNAAVKECNELLEELKRRYETEKKDLSYRIIRMEESQLDVEKDTTLVTAERNHFKSMTRILEKNLRRTNRKLESMESRVHLTRVSRDFLKERLNKTIVYCEKLFGEYEQIVRDREELLILICKTENENVSIDHLGKSITDRVEHLKTQLEIVRGGAKQRLATVEKRIKLQESRVRQMKSEYRRKVRVLKNVLKQKEGTIERLRNEKSGSCKNLKARTQSRTAHVTDGQQGQEEKKEGGHS